MPDHRVFARHAILVHDMGGGEPHFPAGQVHHALPEPIRCGGTGEQSSS